MFAFALGLLLTGCQETEISPVKPDNDLTIPNIVVTPALVEFGELMSNETETNFFTVRNVGAATLTVSGIEIEGSDAFMISDPAGFTLEPDESRDVEVVFQPLVVENTGQAVVLSDDPDEPESLVDLIGYGSVPELAITPDPHDFGTHFVPCGTFNTFQLENVGGDLLIIDAIEHIADGNAFTMTDNNVLPLELLPGEFTTVDIEFIAETEGTVEAELQVTSNDPRVVVSAVQTGTGQYAATGADTFVVPEDPPVDILFAVDQSCSMDDDSQLLGQSFNTFIGQIDAVTQGWQIGVANVDDGCFNNGILSANTMGYQAAFANAVVEGNDPSGDDTWSEKLYTLVDIALGKTNPGQCNSGFLRPGALLHIVLVSDEPERSNQSWSYFYNNWIQYVSDPSLLKVSVIIDDSGCGEGSNGYPQSANQTGGLILDMCTDWSSQIGALGSASLQGIGSFELSQTPDPASIAVTLDGQPVTLGWTYNPTTNEVVFDDAVPQGGTVEISYGIAVACQ